MKKTTQVKIVLKKYLPNNIFTITKKIFNNTYNKIEEYIFLKRTANFTYPKYINIDDKGVAFELLIDPKNGVLDKYLSINTKYERHITEQMHNHIKAGDIVLDIGANIGLHTILLAKITGNSGQVHAFEPIPSIYTQLEKSIEKNNIKNIRVEKFALGEKQEELDININLGCVASSSILDKDVSNMTTNIKIQVKALDSLNLQKVDFIKLDVEGYEWNVIAGGMNTIKRYKPTIIFEYSPDYFRRAGNNDGNKILNFMIDNNYVMYDLENKKKVVAYIESFEKEFAFGLRSQTNILCLQK